MGRLPFMWGDLPPRPRDSDFEDPVDAHINDRVVVSRDGKWVSAMMDGQVWRSGHRPIYRSTKDPIILDQINLAYEEVVQEVGLDTLRENEDGSARSDMVMRFLAVSVPLDYHKRYRALIDRHGVVAPLEAEAESGLRVLREYCSSARNRPEEKVDERGGAMIGLVNPFNVAYQVAVCRVLIWNHLSGYRSDLVMGSPHRAEKRKPPRKRIDLDSFASICAETLRDEPRRRMIGSRSRLEAELANVARLQGWKANASVGTFKSILGGARFEKGDDYVQSLLGDRVPDWRAWIMSHPFSEFLNLLWEAARDHHLRVDSTRAENG